jgi:membrane protein DedA with SNARE-associated domain
MLERIDHLMGSPLAVFGVCAMTGLLIPLPEDVVVLYLGIVVRERELPWFWLFWAAVAGTVARDMAMWAVGRYFGDRLLSQPRVERFVGIERLARMRRLFTERGTQAVVMGRFMAGARVAFFIVAGMMRTPFRICLIWDVIGAIVSTAVEMALGAWLGPPFLETVQWTLARTGPWIWAALLALIGVAWTIRQRRLAHAPKPAA